MKELKVIISGTTGSGKSTFALYLADVLADAGFKVSFSDPDTEADKLELKRELIDSVKENTFIDITTWQKPR